jgi:hypothetical protein
MNLNGTEWHDHVNHDNVNNIFIDLSNMLISKTQSKMNFGIDVAT